MNVPRLPDTGEPEDDGRELHTFIRNDLYTPETGDRSRIEIPVGSALEGRIRLHTGRLRLEVAGDPKWDGKQGQLQIQQ